MGDPGLFLLFSIVLICDETFERSNQCCHGLGEFLEHTVCVV